MIKEDEIFSKVKDACIDTDVSSLSATSSFKKNGLDSMDIASLMLDLEESYGITIPTRDIPSLDNVAAIVEYINKKRE